MKIMKLAIAAALVIGAPAAAFASAPGGENIAAPASAVANVMKGDALKRPRWVTRRVCRTEMRHHHRVRVCRTVRVRR